MIKKNIISAGNKIQQLARAGKLKLGRVLGVNKKKRQENSDPIPAIEKQVKTIDGNRAGKSHDGDITTPRYRAPRQKKRKKSWNLDSFPIEPVEGKVRFHDFDIPLSVMRAIFDQGFEYCTTIQGKALGDVLAGKDLIGKANTGTGKSAVFLITILSRLLEKRGADKKREVRALVLAPTRELVMQIAKDGEGLAKYSNIVIQPVYGGVDYQKQMDSLRSKRCDVVIATPGRLIDFLGKNVVDLSKCKILVLDEADRMLDMGFIPDVRRIVGRTPNRRERQTMLFSATVPGDVTRLASQWCVEPKMVEAEPDQVAVETVEQTVYLATSEDKYKVLYNLIKQHGEDRILVFANMKNETRKLSDRLQRNGIDCVLLSGDVQQNKRVTRLERFRSGKVKVLVATDVAGRGIHIEGITFVVNYTLPYEPEDYVHRIGRTGRAGAAGRAVSFACEEGAFYLPEIEAFIGRKLECIVPEESLLKPPPKGQAAGHKKYQHKSRQKKYRRPKK
ncbi:MAG: DEAD/DEAH box helicase [Desulfobulbaceae bacterium]|nr:DEAD/DEAH box helicase [Desulfobulbaceae bacterium]